MNDKAKVNLKLKVYRSKGWGKGKFKVEGKGI